MFALFKSACRIVVTFALFVSFQTSFGKIMDNGVDPENLGTGQWIYYLSSAVDRLGGNVESVTDIPSLMKFYKSAGIDFIAVKAGTGGEEFPRDNPQFTAELVKEAQTAGIKIFGYTRSDGKDVQGEIELAAKVYDLGADGFIIDAEAEWEAHVLPNNEAKAIQLCEGIRARYPNKFLGHAPFPIISKHSTFPYKEFGYYCDAVMPQDYWKSIGVTPKRMVQWMDEEWHRWHKSLTGKWTNSIKPLAPIGQGWNPSNDKIVTGSEIVSFITALNHDSNPVTPGGYKGVSYWRTDLHTARMWKGITRAKIGDPNTTPIALLQDGPGDSVASPTPDANTNAIIVDDDSPEATFTGNWTPGVNPAGRYGTTYKVANIVAGDATATAIYRPAITDEGDYDVYIWYSSHQNRSQQAPWVITTTAGNITNKVDQTVDGGKWFLLASNIRLSAGTSATVSISNDTKETSDSFLVADAVRFVRKMPKGAIVAAVSQPKTKVEKTPPADAEAGDPAPVVAPRPYNPNDVILDDQDTNVVFEGDWYPGKKKHGRFGESHMCANAKSNDTTATATYRPVIANTGTYDVFVWYCGAPNRSRKAPWVLNYGGNVLTNLVDLSNNIGQWNLIAANIPLTAGTNTSLSISNQTGENEEQVIIADAIRFLRKDGKKNGGQ